MSDKYFHEALSKIMVVEEGDPISARMAQFALEVYNEAIVLRGDDVKALEAENRELRRGPFCAYNSDGTLYFETRSDADDFASSQAASAGWSVMKLQVIPKKDTNKNLT